MSKDKGLILVNTGNGKGKSTSAFGLALRALGHDQKVCIIQFMKGDTSNGEFRTFKEYLPMVRFEATGSTNFVDRDNPDPFDLDEAERGLALATEALSGGYDLVILDEINVAMDFGLLSIEAVLRLLDNKSEAANVMLTGRSAPERIRERADMVSEINEVKHHFYQGIPAKPGIEF